MRRYTGMIAAVAIAWGGVGLATAQEHQPQEQQRTEVRTERDRTADRPLTDRIMEGVTRDDRQLSDREMNNIRGTISTATEAALTEGQLRSLAQRLTTADEARLARDLDRDQEQLDAVIRQYRQAFEARYGEDFNIDDREAAYPPAVVQIRPGLTQEAMLVRGIQDPEQPRELREVEERRIEAEPAGEMQREDQQLEAEVRTDEQRVEAEVERDGAVVEQREVRTLPGQDNLATVVLSEEHGYPTLHIPLVNEGTVFDAWRIDIPLDMDAQKLRTNLQQNLQQALGNQEQWPADINAARRMTTHLVMMSLFDEQRDAAQQVGEALEG